MNTGHSAAAATSELNRAVAEYYDTTLDLYEELWGEHVHHGYWDPGESPSQTGTDRQAACDRTVRELVAFAELRSGAAVLDVGCGIGGPAIHLARELGCHVEGITLSSQQVARAGEKAREAGVADRTSFRLLDVLSNDYAAESFDVVWALESVMHIPDAAAFYAEAMRILRPGGTLAVAAWCVRDAELEPADQRLLRQILRYQVMPGLLSREEHEKHSRNAGFDEVRTQDWSKAVSNSWNPAFTLIRPLDNRTEYVRELARDKGVDVLGFFYAGPLMTIAFDSDVVRYGVLRATKPAPS